MQWSRLPPIDWIDGTPLHSGCILAPRRQHPMLTKSDYLRYFDCPIHLWLFNHPPDGAVTPIDIHAEWTFEQGAMVEAQARGLFPDGEFIAGHTQASERQTLALIAGGATTIFQGTAIHDDLLAMADIVALDPESHGRMAGDCGVG